MQINFTKMQACGNDYIYLDCLASPPPESPEKIARALCPRHFSVGGDGVVLILPPTNATADAKIRIFNADGSEAVICGSALRSAALLLYLGGYARRSRIAIECEVGVREVILSVRDGKVVGILAELGQARVTGGVRLSACGNEYEAVTVEIGNRHAVCFVPDVDAQRLDKIAESARREGDFNLEVCEYLGDNRIRVRVFERGSGETLSCGSGACAVAAAAAARGLIDAKRPVEILMRGGALTVRDGGARGMLLSGAAEIAFCGIAEVRDG